MKIGDLIRIKPEFIKTSHDNEWRKKQGVILEIEGQYAVVYWDQEAPCLIEYMDYLEKIPLTKPKNRLYYRDKEAR